MDEPVRLVSQKLGLSEDVARQAVEPILNQLKQHFPAPLAGQIDGLLQGSASLTDLSNPSQTGGGLMKTLGGLFGKK